MRYLLKLNQRLGDLAIDTAVINAIARLDSDHHIEALLHPAVGALLDEHPALRARHAIAGSGAGRLWRQLRLARRGWDVVINFRRTPHLQLFQRLAAARHRRSMQDVPEAHPTIMLQRLSLLDGVLDGWADDIDNSIPFDQRRTASVRARLGLAARTRFACISPGASTSARQWPARLFARLAAGLEDRFDCILVLGAAAERQLCAQVAEGAGARSIAGELELLDLAALLAQTELHIGNDSGLGHVAAGCGARCLTIGGLGTDYLPWGQTQQPGEIGSITLEQVELTLARMLEQ